MQRGGCARRLVDQLARVGHLAAAVGVERRLAELAEERAVAELLQGADLRQHVRLLVADEPALEAGRLGELGGALDVGLLAPGAGDLAVALHQLAEAVDVDGLAPLLGELLRQLDREAEGGDQGECVVARDRRPRRRAPRTP